MTAPDLARAVEIYAAVHFAVIGLSHVLQPGVWVQFFIALRNQGHVGVFANSFLSLMFGSIIVAFHNVWSDETMILTLIGWAQIAKALIGFCFPAVAMLSLNRVSPGRTWEFQIPGVIFLGLAAWLIIRLTT
jgi:hypothetical protein